ncbi:MAG: ABC transporter ATP-binding protein, partial [Actinomycetota bacterium]
MSNGQPVKQPNLSNEPGGRWATIGMPLARASDFRTVFKKLLIRFRTERLRLIFVIVFGIVGVGLSVYGPRLLGRATDILVEGLLAGGRAGIDFNRLHRTLLFALLLYVTATSFQYVQAYILAGVIQRSMYRLREDIEEKINRLPLSYIDRAARGDLLSRVTNDIDNLAQTLQQTISQLLMNTFMLIGTVAMMFAISWLLAIVVVVSIPLSLGFIRFITKRSKGRFIAQWAHTGELNALVEESLTGHAIVKAFGRQKDAEQVFRMTNDKLFDASFNASFMSGSIQPATVFIGNLTFVGIAVIGGMRVASGAMTIGGIQAFIQYARQFSHPVQMLASMANLFQSGLASAERVF